MTPGTQLGPYSIVAELGAGGMGEVYRARDTRLDRTVALKVLPTHLRDDPQLRKRFERESRAVSSLNHPHICILHDIGNQDGIDYLVMEYLEGETLAQRLEKGPLSLDQVNEYAIQIADALAQAHRLGVLHRDLKPGNIMLTKAGAKLLDFGLAKVSQPLSPEGPTETDLTEEGTLVGTLHYMAPEQLEGKPVDARSDIFSFGAVLYEMATGRKAFTGESRASVMAAILKSDPPPISGLPPDLDRIVRACLAKKPEERWHSAHDLTRELKWVSERESSTAASAPARTSHKRGGWIAAGLLAAALAGGLIAWRLTGTKPAARTVVRLSIPVAEVDLQSGTVLALSPDGTRLVYAAGLGSGSRLYLRPIDQLQSTPINGTEGAVQPFFSPDGQWVGFFAGGKLKKVPVTGGVTQTICPIPGGLRGADWAPDDTIFFGDPGTGLSQVQAAGGTPQVVTTLDRKKGEINHWWPKVLPGGKEVLFTIRTNAADHHIAVESLTTHERRSLTKESTYARYDPGGRLVYTLDGVLLASLFDLRRLEVTGPPIPILENLETDPQLRNGQFAVSETGSLVYVSETGPTVRTLVWVDRQGASMPLKAPERYYEFPRLSPDGQRLAVDILDGAHKDVWIYDLVRDAPARLTYDGRSTVPEWTPDGKRLVFASSRAGQQNLYLQAADGSGKAERLLPSENMQYAGSWSPDRRVLAFVELIPRNPWHIWVLPLEGERTPRIFLQGPANVFDPRISPDGRWLAYVSRETGRYEIFVTSFPSGNGKWQVSSEGGTEAMWGRDGRELFYRNGDKMMTVGIEAKSSFTSMKPRLLFARSRAGRNMPGLPGYDVAPDGKRFLMVKDSEAEPVPVQLNVVVNWSEELSRQTGAAVKK